MLSVPPDDTVPHTLATPVVPAAEHGPRHGHDLGFVLDGTGPQFGVQGIGLGVDGVDLVQELDVLRPTVVHGARGEPVSPFRLLPLGQLPHLGQDLGPGTTGGGELPVGVVRLAVRAQLGFENFDDEVEIR